MPKNTTNFRKEAFRAKKTHRWYRPLKVCTSYLLGVVDIVEYNLLISVEHCCENCKVKKFNFYHELDNQNCADPEFRSVFVESNIRLRRLTQKFDTMQPNSTRLYCRRRALNCMFF